MVNLETLKRSIGSAEDLAGVVRTMKTMAAVSIRQYEMAAESLNVYSRTIDTGLSMVLQNSAHSLSPEQAESGLTGALVFGSDQGMCGQFNEQIGQFTADVLSEEVILLRGVAPVLCVGHRVADTLVSNAVQVEQTFPLPGSATGITWLVQDLLSAMDRWRETHRIGRILVFHNRRISASAWNPHSLQLLPLDTERFQRKPADNEAKAANRSLPLWTMNTSVLFSRLVKQFLFVSLFRACAESLAGENASRIAAMQAAERNIRDRLHLLRSEFAQRRQTAITEELLDVVTGFELLSQQPTGEV